MLRLIVLNLYEPSNLRTIDTTLKIAKLNNLTPKEAVELCKRQINQR